MGPSHCIKHFYIFVRVYGHNYQIIYGFPSYHDCNSSSSSSSNKTSSSSSSSSEYVTILSEVVVVNMYSITIVSTSERLYTCITIVAEDWDAVVI